MYPLPSNHLPFKSFSRCDSLKDSMDESTDQISHQYSLCQQLFIESGLDPADLFLWGTEFKVADGLNCMLRRSSSLRRLLLSHLKSLEKALNHYVALQRIPVRKRGTSRDYSTARDSVASEVYNVLCLSSELRDPLPSDNLELLTATAIREEGITEIERVSHTFPNATESLQKRIGISNWIRKREIEDRHRTLLHKIPIPAKRRPESFEEARRRSANQNSHLQRSALDCAQ